MFQDIRIPRKSLREVLPKGDVDHPSRIKKSRKVADEPAYRKPARSQRGWIWFLIVLVLVVAASLFLSQFFATVLVEATPKQYEVALNSSAFTVPYESVAIPTIKDSKTVTAKLGQGVAKKASGTIVVYNNYNSQPQTLIVNTRFQAASSKIYRITKQITVPGTRVVGGKTVPGSVEATVVADQTGSAYNAGLTDFTIPGFQGDPRYSKFSAKSKTAMTGGSDGEEWVAEAGELEKASAELKRSLLQKAAEQVRFQIPSTFVLYDSNIIPTFKEEITSAAGEGANQATLTMSLEAEAIIFDRDVLSQALVASSLPADNNQPFTITNLDQLGITINQDLLKNDGEKVTITADGKAKVKLSVDPNLLSSKLVDLDLTQAQEIFQNFPGLLEAKVNFRPPWIRSFPKDAGKIRVLIP